MINPSEWLEELKRENVLELFNTGTKTFLRLVAPCQFVIPENMIRDISAEYVPDLEKGGYFLFSYKKNNGLSILTLQKIIWIENIEIDYPCGRYTPDMDQYQDAYQLALDECLIPCFFHTHPTNGDNVVSESIMYIRQMDTSTQDRVTSLKRWYRDYHNLRLPEFLVICKGNIKSEVFIGIYGGLIASLEFANDTTKMIGDFIEEKVEKAGSFFNTPERKILGILGVIGAIYLIAKNPKTSLTLSMLAATILPGIISGERSSQQGFAISYGSAMTIDIQKRFDEEVLADERTIEELINGKNQSQSKVA